MIPWSWPRPRYVLHENPEIACVDAVGIALEICVAVLKASNPVNEDGWPSPSRDNARAWLAQNVVAQAEALHVAIERYRSAVRYDELSVRRGTNDFPF